MNLPARLLEHAELIEAKALGHGLRASLLFALVDIESSGRKWAWNPEPRYRYFFDLRNGKPFRAISEQESRSEFPPPDFIGYRGRDADAEWWGQQASWGLCQVMGAVARERGFVGPDFPELCDPYFNLEIGAIHLKRFIDRYGDVEGVAAYNAGPGGRQGELGQAYAGKVLGREQELLA